MDRDAQQDMVERIMRINTQRTTTLADATLEIPAANDASATRCALESSTIFRDQPMVACMSVDLRDPGDVVTLESGGIPVVVVRGSDGDVHAYVNACRHRGTAVAQGRHHVARTFNCPFHFHEMRDAQLAQAQNSLVH